jgi:hypothetical protein
MVGMEWGRKSFTVTIHRRRVLSLGSFSRGGRADNERNKHQAELRICGNCEIIYSTGPFFRDALPRKFQIIK